MPASARTTAIIWAIALVLDLASIGALIASLIIHPNHREWYLIAFVVLVAICAVFAALTSWRWWRIHQAQNRAAIPYYASPPPAPAR
ncbi:hypothetical protein C8R47DRAFT_1131321 [Mycena vitilis]|nr:hypothetical protein C8R47DRAFT_1131321 [Mycena vitilis]